MRSDKPDQVNQTQPSILEDSILHAVRAQAIICRVLYDESPSIPDAIVAHRHAISMIGDDLYGEPQSISDGIDAATQNELEN